MTSYVFFRDGMFYVADCKNDDEAIKCAHINEGTRRVEDMGGRQVWPGKPAVVPRASGGPHA